MVRTSFTEREEAEAEEKIRLKQYVSLRSKGRHNNGMLRTVYMIQLQYKVNKGFLLHLFYCNQV
jgi:hypothetical protein